MKYLAFVLDQQSINDLKTLFPCIYEKEKCHHITVYFGDTDGDSFKRKIEDLTEGDRYPDPEFFITGHFNDNNGIECFQVNMVTFFEDESMLNLNELHHPWRYDGVLYHLTHSISVERQAVESKVVVSNNDYCIRKIKLFLNGQLKVLDYIQK